MMLMKLGLTLVLVFALLRIVRGSIPSTPTNLTTMNIGSRSINILWVRPAQDGNSTRLKYLVFYKSGDIGIQTVEVQSATTATLSVKPYRKYDIYVMAGNQDGYGAPTLKMTLTSSEEEPEKCPKVTYIERDGTTLEVGWKEVLQEYQNGKIKGYVISAIGRNTNMINVTVNSGDTVYRFQNFSSKENYGFKVAAFNSAGYCKGYQNLSLYHEFVVTTAPATTAPATTAAEATTAEATTAEATTAPVTAEKTTAEATTAAEETAEATTKAVQTITCIPKEPTNAVHTGETLASTAVSDWWMYILIALAVIITIMGVTIFLLIWQLYKNRRQYKAKERRDVELTPNKGIDNQAHDNTV